MSHPAFHNVLFNTIRDKSNNDMIATGRVKDDGKKVGVPTSGFELHTKIAAIIRAHIREWH